MQKIDKNNNKNNNGKDISLLFEKILVKRDKSLKNLENIKQKVTVILDKEISRLYAKKDFVKEIFLKRKELRLKKTGVFKKIISTSFKMNLIYIFSMPFIYGLIIPTIFMHITVELYHQVAFRLYSIPRVRARDYFIFDRKSLPYLNWLERFNCFYCSYFNCLVAYIREIGGRTERYWCPIKHSKNILDHHKHYNDFVDYDDGENFRTKWKELRDFSLRQD